MWRLELFGGLRAIRENELVERFRTQKTAALLAYFALKPGPQPREVLINLLWPDAEPEAARNSLSASLSSLRRQLEPDLSPGSVILSTRAHVGLHPEVFTCDVAEFDTSLKGAARAQTDEERIQALARAVEIYGGPLLPGFYDDWISLESRRREEEFSESLSDLLDLLDGEDDWDRLIGFARHGLSLLPAREEWHLALMRALQMTGKPEAALRQFEELRTILSREGEQPSPKANRLSIEAQRGRDAKRLAELVAEEPSEAVEFSAPIPQVTPSPESEVAVPLSETTTYLMLKRPPGAPEQEFIVQTLESHGGRLEQQWPERMLWNFESCLEAAHAAIAVQTGLTTYPPEQRVSVALCTQERWNNQENSDDAAFERVRILMQGAHRGQILSDEASTRFARAGKLGLLDLGRYRLVSAAPQRLFQLEYPNSPTFAPPRLMAASASNLPPQFTRFFGREREIEQLHRLLSSEGSPLITLLGPGGCGKTRLAIEAARTFGDERFAIYFVPLADISGEAFVFPAIRDALKLPPQTGMSPRDQLFEALSSRATLLILDNFEQLVEEGAACVQELLRASPHLRVLVTSRQMLNVPGEREFPVAPLPVPGEDTSAQLLQEISSAALFIDRAQASRVDFRADDRNAPFIAAICQRLDGIPLALELAAARSLVLSPAQMLEKLRDRLDILSTRQRGVPERHRTLRAAIEWSYSLLPPELQQFFVSLSVFRGGWTLDAAEVVCEEPDALDFLTRLRECSLVVTQERGDETRFRMLETLREYAATQLKPAQSARLEELYAAYFGRLSERAEPHLRGPQQAQWLERLEVEQDNFRAVLSWSIEHDANAALSLAAALSPFWETRGHYAEGRDWLERALALQENAVRSTPTKVPLKEEGVAEQKSSRKVAQLGVWPEAEAAFEPTSPGAMRGRALCSAGRMAWFESELGEAHSLLEKGLALLRGAGDEVGVVNAISSLSMVLAWQGEEARCFALLEEGLRIVRPWEQRRDLLPTLANFSWALSFASLPQTINPAREMNQLVANLARVAGDKRSLAWALDSLAQNAAWRRDYQGCLRISEEAVSLFEELEERFGKSHLIWVRGNAAREIERFADARNWNNESLSLMLQMDNRVGLPFVLESYAYLDMREGHFQRAALLLGAVEAIREVGVPRHALVAIEYQNYIEILRSKLNEVTFARAWERGRELSVESALAQARRELNRNEDAP